VTSLISIQYVIIICNDVTRASLNKIGQNLLTTHFLASLHVCDTIERLILVRVPHMAKLLSKLIYSRVIAVSLLGRDKFHRYIEGFLVCYIARNLFVTKIETYIKTELISC
jgi:hypothetical protein